LSNIIDSATAHSHKKEKGLVSASDLKDNDSYASSLNSTNLSHKGFLSLLSFLLYVTQANPPSLVSGSIYSSLYADFSESDNINLPNPPAHSLLVLLS
jgi:hypothetical protein